MKTKIKKRNTKDPILEISPSGCLSKQNKQIDQTSKPLSSHQWYIEELEVEPDTDRIQFSFTIKRLP